MIEKEAFRVTIAFPGEKYSLLEFDRRCSRVRSVVQGIVAPIKLGHRLREQLDFQTDRSWLVYSVRCSGQLPLVFELEQEFNARAALEGEVESARLLWQKYFSVLSNLLSRASVSGMELEEMREQLPEMNAVYRAFKGRDGSAKTAYRFEDPREVQFQLSPLPHRFMGQEVVEFKFRVKSAGPARAQGRLTEVWRAKLGATRRDIELLWEPDPGDRSISTSLFAASHTHIEMTAAGRLVYRSNGRVAAIVLQSLKSRRQCAEDAENRFAKLRTGLELDTSPLPDVAF